MLALASLITALSLSQILDIQDPQEDRVAHRADGRREGSVQDLPVVPVDVLAAGLQGADLHQRLGGADEHGGEVEAEDGLRPGGCGQPGRDREVRGLLRRQRLHRAGHPARRGGRLPGSEDGEETQTSAGAELGEIFLSVKTLLTVCSTHFRLSTSTAMIWSSTMFSTICIKNNQNNWPDVDLTTEHPTIRSQHSHINTITTPCPPLQYDTIRTPFFLPSSRKCQSNIL